MTYLWLKAGHIIFVIFWMAGLFMLPRYFVYHQESPPGSPEEALWIDREMRLRTRATAPKVLVRGRRWAHSRSFSNECRFFCSG